MSRRDEIIDAAIRVAERAAPERTTLSVRAVAKEAGIGPSTLRHYFPTQSELHHAVARRSMQSVAKDFSIADPSIDPAERLYECCAQFMITAEHRDLQLAVWFRMHLNALGPEAKEESLALLQHAHEITYDCLHRWLGILADEGHLDPGMIDRSATILFTALDGTALHAMITPETMTVEESHANIRWLIETILA